MPIYEYQCQSCQAELEKLQRMSDAPLTDCPTCGAAALVKKISAPGFRLKGGGWYETDFKSGNKRNLAGDQDSGSSSDKKPESSRAGESKSKDSSTGKTESKAVSSAD